VQRSMIGKVERGTAMPNQSSIPPLEPQLGETAFQSLEHVRALIDAKIAANSVQAGSTGRWRRSIYSGRNVTPPKLPRGLCVPSSEPRPPNLHAVNLSFAARLVIAVRDRFHGDAPSVYKTARLTSAAYSRIISDETQKVNKRTAIRFVFALRLDPAEARMLLASAGFAFSYSQTEDFILESCLEADPPIYDFDVVNALLREYHVDYQY